MSMESDDGEYEANVTLTKSNDGKKITLEIATDEPMSNTEFIDLLRVWLNHIDPEPVLTDFDDPEAQRH